jgi:hypothetical protein
MRAVRYFIAGLSLGLILMAVNAWATSRSQFLLVDPVPPTVLASGDVGFRVEGLRGGSAPVGTLVVRINGQWIEAEVREPGQNLPFTYRAPGDRP